MVKIKLTIDGMACSMCEAHVNDAIRNSFEIKKIKSSHKKGTTEFTAQAAPSEEELRRVLDSTGYRITSYSAEEM